MSEETLDVRRKRLKFRAWHRGIKEMDLIMGTFADTHVATLSETEIDQFEAEIREILQQKELAIKKADLSMAKELQQRQNEIEEQIQSCKAKEERRIA